MDKRYWSSAEDAGGSVPERPLDPPPGWSRRSFLRLAGFGVTTGLLAGCSPGPVKSLMPRKTAAEHGAPGIATYFASTCGACPAGCGILVKNRDGRPIKIEGYRGGDENARAHPVSGGGLCSAGQASLLEAYDKQRIAAPRTLDGPGTWDAIDREIVSKLRAARPGGVAVLSESITSPSTREALRGFLTRFPGARHVTFDPDSASAVLEAHRRCFGRAVLPRYRFDRADVILGADCDFLGTWVSPVEFSGAYANKRGDQAARRSWHTHMEAHLSVTGSKADQRVVARSGERLAILAGIAADLARRAGRAFPVTAPLPKGRAPLVEQVSDRLWKARRRSLVVSGRNDPSEQVVVAFLNDVLGNYGETLDLERPSLQRQGSDGDLEALLKDMDKGLIDVLVMADTDLVYAHPDPARISTTLEKVGTRVVLARRDNDSSRGAHFVLPTPHHLETWDDAEPIAGVVAITQPVIKPRGTARTLRASLTRWTGNATGDRELVKNSLRRRLKADAATFDRRFDRIVHDGFTDVPVASAKPSTFRKDALAGVSVAEAPGDGFEVALYREPGTLDGRHAHNAWLQEMPDPITKTTWGNAALLSPAACRELGVRTGDEVRLERSEGRSVEVPVLEQPGMHDRSVAVAAGYGCRGTDRFANVGPDWLEATPTVQPGGRIGANAKVLAAVHDGFIRDGSAVRIVPTGRRVPLAIAQGWASIDLPENTAPGGKRRRPIVEEVTLGAEPATHHGHGDADLWPSDHDNAHPQWGMVIDLDRCTGCAACVVACQVENNVPVVGRDEVLRQREMHWMRIDRYFSGDPDAAESVEVIHQPMLCQHCDNAPCESVCPVLATVQSEEGLNQQVYNRCVGTRYCANNCPYKTRRFNWFDYAHEDQLLNLALNPDVTVRSRGVMEKCSFCVQRIQESKARAKREGRPLADGDVEPACVQTCPTSAIVFGDDTDAESELARKRRDPRHFRVLEELNVKPSVGYQAVIRRGDRDG